MISFEQVSFDYRSDDAMRRALDEVTLQLEPGRMVAVLGANGSGKSTLARLANGLTIPTSGRVTVDGIDTRDDFRSRELRQLVGSVFQHPDDQIVATTVEDDVAFGPENLGLQRDEIRRRVDQAIAAVGLDGLERREPHLLSGGQKQRLAIAGALALRPRYLVLDEPTSMLDPVGRDEVSSALRSLKTSGHGILLVTHDLTEVLLADSVTVLDRGRVAWTGAPMDLLALGERLALWNLERPALIRVVERLRQADVLAPFGTVHDLEAYLWA